MCSVKIPATINSIRRLKDYIASELKLKNSTEMVIFNFKGLELDDSDIYYINSGDVLCASLDGHAFDSANYINMYDFIKNVKAGGYGKVYIASNVFTGEKVAIKKIDTKNLCKIIKDYLFTHSFRGNL
jgi:hypothetical protein